MARMAGIAVELVRSNPVLRRSLANRLYSCELAGSAEDRNCHWLQHSRSCSDRYSGQVAIAIPVVQAQKAEMGGSTGNLDSRCRIDAANWARYRSTQPGVVGRTGLANTRSMSERWSSSAAAADDLRLRCWQRLSYGKRQAGHLVPRQNHGVDYKAGRCCYWQ